MRAFYVCSKSENLLEDEPWTSKFFDIRIWLAFVRIVARFYNLLPCVLKSSYLFELYYIYVIKTYWQFLIPPHQDTLGIEVEDVCCHCMYPWKIPGIWTTNLHNLFLLGILFGIFGNLVKTYSSIQNYFSTLWNLLAISDPSTSRHAWYQTWRHLLSLHVSMKDAVYLHN